MHNAAINVKAKWPASKACPKRQLTAAPRATGTIVPVKNGALSSLTHKRNLAALLLGLLGSYNASDMISFASILTTFGIY